MPENWQSLENNDKDLKEKKNEKEKNNDWKDKVNQDQKAFFEKKMEIDMKECKELLDDCNWKQSMDELEKDAMISNLQKYLNAKGEVQWAARDMIYQIENNKIPFKSLLNPEEQQRRKSLIEGKENQPWMIEKISERIKNEFKIDAMNSFGIDTNNNIAEFEIMKQKMLDDINNNKISIEYFSSSDIGKITWFNNSGTWAIEINVWAMNVYKNELEFESHFKETLIHELLHWVQREWQEKLLNPDTGISKEICWEDKEARNFLTGMFTEGWSIMLANSISWVTEQIDNYHFHSILGLNQLFYGNKDKTNSYWKIFSKLRYFGKIENEDRITLINYIKQEFSNEPIKWYLELKKQDNELSKSNPTNEKQEEMNNKVFDKMLEMAWNNMEWNDFLKKVYPGWQGEETIKKIKELEEKQQKSQQKQWLLNW